MTWLTKLLRLGGSEPRGAVAPAPAIAPGSTNALAEIDELLDSNVLDAAEQRLTTLGADKANAPPALRLRFARLTRRRGDAATAYALCEALLADDCDAAAVQLEMADCSLTQHDLARAVEHAEIAVSLDGDRGLSWLRLGQLHLRLDRHGEAERALEQATSSRSLSQTRQADAWFALGEVRRVSRHPGAVNAYMHCIEQQPTHVDAHIGLAHAFLMDEDDEQALVWYQRAIDLGARIPPPVRLNIGTIHQNAGRYDEARRQFDHVLSERPSDHTARFYLCMLDLLTERWADGWRNFPARFASGAAPYRPMPYSPWDGRSLADEPLLILADEGLGDEIMYASCLPDLSARVKHCIVECEPRLLALFRRSFPQVHVVATQRENSTQWLDGLPTPKWQICAGDMPALFRRCSEDFPRHSGYLRADPDKVATWKQRLQQHSPNQLLIGISWRGGTAGTRTKARSLPIDDWAPLLTLPGITFVNLQYGAYQADLAALQGRYGVDVLDFPEVQVDYDENAALVCALDGVVSVCTAIVHLAGALGQRAWVLAPLAPGWRYTAHAQHMPWYPSVTVFRQELAGDWQAPCQKVSLTLAALTNGGPSSATDRDI